MINDLEFYITRWQDADYFYKQIQVSENGNTVFKHLFKKKLQNLHYLILLKCRHTIIYKFRKC